MNNIQTTIITSILTVTILAATAPNDNIRLWKVEKGNNRQVVLPGSAPLRFSKDGFIVAYIDPDNPDIAIVKNLGSVFDEDLTAGSRARQRMTIASPQGTREVCGESFTVT